MIFSWHREQKARQCQLTGISGCAIRAIRTRQSLRLLRAMRCRHSDTSRPKEKTPMFHLTSRFPFRKSRHRIYAILAGILVINLMGSLSGLNSGPAIAQTGPLVQNDFEDGTVQGW